LVWKRLEILRNQRRCMAHGNLQLEWKRLEILRNKRTVQGPL